MNRMLLALLLAALTLAAPLQAPLLARADATGSLGALISAINHTDANIPTLQAMSSVSAQNITLTDANLMLHGADYRALRNALDQNALAVGTMQKVLGDIAVTQDLCPPDHVCTCASTPCQQAMASFLSARNILIGNVVDVEASSGSLNIFYLIPPALTLVSEGCSMGVCNPIIAATSFTPHSRLTVFAGTSVRNGQVVLVLQTDTFGNATFTLPDQFKFPAITVEEQSGRTVTLSLACC